MIKNQITINVSFAAGVIVGAILIAVPFGYYAGALKQKTLAETYKFIAIECLEISKQQDYEMARMVRLLDKSIVSRDQIGYQDE